MSVPETLTEAIDILAKRAVFMRSVREVQKQAFGFDMSQIKDQLGQFGGQAMEQIKQHPQIAGTLLGAGGGALLGGATSLAKDPEERQTGNNMLTGALAGAGLGLGGSYMLPYLQGQKGGLMPGLDPEKQQQVDALDTKGKQITDTHDQSPPTVLGTFAKDSPYLAGAGAIDYAQHNMSRAQQPEDIIKGLAGSETGKAPLGDELTRGYLDRAIAANKTGKVKPPKMKDISVAQFADNTFSDMSPEQKQQLLRATRGQTMLDKALQWTRDKVPYADKIIGDHGPANLPESITHAQIPGSRGFPEGGGARLNPRSGLLEREILGRNDFRTALDRGHSARMAEQGLGSAMHPKALGARGLGYIGLPLLHHYLLRKAMHEMESPMG